MKVTRINDTQLVITLPTGRAFTVGRMDGLKRIIFEEKDDLDGFWRVLLENADELGATTGPKTAELEMLSKRIDALENNDKCNDTAQKHCRELIRNLETRVSNLSTTCATDYRDHENRIADLEKVTDSAHVQDIVAEYIADDETGFLRRRIVNTIADKLLNR